MTPNFQQFPRLAFIGLGGLVLLACNTTALDITNRPKTQVQRTAPPDDRVLPQSRSARLESGQESLRNQPESQVSSSPTEPKSGGCLSPRQTRDPDIIRNASRLSTSEYCIRLAAFTEGGIPWKIFTISSKGGSRGPFWAVPHDDENTAFDTAVYGLQKYGGSIATVEAGERRTFRGQDTNRNFGTTNTIARRCSQQRAAAPRFVREFLKNHRRGGLIVALHTNKNGYSGNGGSGTISINRKSSIMRAYKSVNASGALKDEDNLLLTASKNLVAQDSKLRRLVNHFNKQGVHVIAEHVLRAKNDCSLSNYIILNNLGRYYNIEVQKGASGAQKEIVNRLMSYRSR